jgi:hypothetical protein
LTFLLIIWRNRERGGGEFGVRDGSGISILQSCWVLLRQRGS